MSAGKNMKVVLAVYRDDEISGGSVRVAEVLAKAMLMRNVELHVVVAYGDGGRLASQLGHRCVLMGASGPKDMAAWARYRKCIKRLSPDVVHYVDSVGWMVLAGVWLRPKRVMHQHFRPDVGPFGHRRFQVIRWLLGTADKVVAISYGAGRQLVTKCHIAPEKVAVVHNAVDQSYLSSYDQTIDPKKCVLGIAARVVEDKGIEDALNLLALLPNRFELLIAGDGPARRRLEALADDLDLSTRVRWMGSVSDIDTFFASIDLYLFMSWYEGFGLSVAEAMLCGRPVVGLLGDGEIAELEYPLVTDENSVLIRRSSPGHFGVERDRGVLQRLKDAICDLDGDYGRRLELATAGVEWVAHRFSSDQHASRMHDVYRSVLSVTSSTNGGKSP